MNETERIKKVYKKRKSKQKYNLYSYFNKEIYILFSKEKELYWTF